MTSIIYKQGDIFKSDADVIMQGCNCFERMKSGLAAFVLKLYPGAVKVDKVGRVGDITKLGTYTSWTGKNAYLDKDVTIVNAYTQFTHYPGNLPFVYDAFVIAFTKLLHDTPSDKKIALPRIGCGLAGGEWSVVERMINSICKDQSRIVDVYIFDKEEYNKVINKEHIITYSNYIENKV